MVTEMICQWGAFWLPMKTAWSNFRHMIATMMPSVVRLPNVQEETSSCLDPTPPEELIPTRMWLPGLAATIALGSVVMKMQHDMHVRESLLAFLLAFLLSFLTTQATGATGRDNRAISLSP